jgi:hypothetical protein
MTSLWTYVYIQVTAAASSDAGQEDGWVVCRVFKKKHHVKESGSGGGGGKHGHHRSKAAAHGQYSSSDDTLDQILQYMGRSCKQEHEILSPQSGSAGRPGPGYLRPIETVLGGHGFMKLPPLESPSAATTTAVVTPPPHVPGEEAGDGLVHGGGNGITDWAMMDRLVASHLNGQPDAPADDHELCNFHDDGAADALAFYSAAATRLLGSGASGSDDDLWSFARSAATSSTERLIG